MVVNKSSLHLAAQNGNLEMVKLLLPSRNWNSKDKFGKTPLDYAKANNHTDIMKELTKSKKHLAAKIRRSKILEQLQRALISGAKKKVYRGRVMLIGPWGAGKTSIMNSLLNEDCEVKHTTTDPFETFHIDITEWIIRGNEEYFHARNPEETRDLIERVLASEVVRQDAERRHARYGPTLSDQSTPKQESGPMGKEETRNTGQSKRDRNFEPIGITNKDLVKLLKKPGQNESESLKRIERRLKKAVDTDSIDFYFSLWDVGGHCDIIYPAFFAYRVIYIFVTDLTKGLDDILELPPQNQTARYWKDMPLKDNANFWINAIHTHTMRDFVIKAHGQDESEEHTIVAPPVIIAGTKKDLLEGDVEKESQGRLCELRKYLRQHTQSAWNSHVTFPMFALDNKSRHNDKTTDPSIESLRKRIQELAKEFCFLGDIPVNWLILELILRSEEKETLQLSDVHRLGKERGLSTEEIEKALKYFHDVGEIIHFADVDELKDTVIIDPRWLINLFSLLTTKSVSYKTNPELSIELLNMFDELYNHGMMKRELVSQWLKLHDREQDTDILLKILEMFDIICQCSLEIDVYYFPCLLKSEPPRKFLFPTGYMSCEPLYFHFRGNFLPEGLYYRLIVRCLEKHPEAMLFQDHARFIHNESIDHHFTLCRKGADIELKMLRLDILGERIIQHLYEKVRQEVETSLNELIRMYTPGLTYHICIKCGCGDHRDGIWLHESNDFDDGCTDITPVLDQGVKQLHCELKNMLQDSHQEEHLKRSSTYSVTWIHS
uniref:Uncharacterized protein LOC102801461 n=1 Tax=Saccoglossus kowalevskii TaxID=10224 RepID=A0ABM0MTW4_SACKO|nr:PREDICTED: uncharacterized protein LOC102801461 [Saccoglossus kowalevskii]